MFWIRAIAIGILFSACAPSGSREEPGAADSVAESSSTSEGAQELPLEIHWVRNSAEYRAAFEQTYRLAGMVLEQKVGEREPGTWAVAIDADETLISNSQQSKERALGNGHVYFEKDWDEWVNRRAAPALPGAKRFLAQVHELGGKIAVVTNRRDRHCPQTAENLVQEEVPFDVILCRGETRDKQPRWTRVEDGTASDELSPLDIVMWIGDNIHDFPELDQELRFDGATEFSEFGDTYFILPNPLYGSWEDNPHN